MRKITWPQALISLLFLLLLAALAKNLAQGVMRRANQPPASQSQE